MKIFTSSHFHKQNLTNLNQHHLNQVIQPKSHKDSLFAQKTQKQFFIEKLKKGTLFKLSHHLKSQPQIHEIDPYLHWLQQNSILQHSQSKIHDLMGQTFFYLNVQEQKQKKLTQPPLLPKISKINQSTPNLISCKIFEKQKKTNQNRKKKILKELKLQDPKILVNNLKKHKGKMSNLFSSLRSLKYHKTQCLENKLNKTQCFPIAARALGSFYTNKENLIKSNFYLNDHKKYPYSQTFYINKNKNLNQDYDLKRINGLNKRSCQTLQQNLKKLQKKGHVSCYNELSGYFLRMKKQMSNFIEHQKQNLRSSEFAERRQTELKVQKQLNRLKTVNIEQSQNSKSHVEGGYLPDFLMKTISSPHKSPKNSVNQSSKRSTQNYKQLQKRSIR